ncbi:MAG: putative Indolepyruvate oxidoreductase subunit IorB [Promethearchaeota archaeon]|nr:MAG: putative Indolepyruvate oxidoreductase subunit IorB [Candidatus Lokiarchaeota archaeon]
MGDIYNILVAGVGGQGVISLAKILREYGMKADLIKNVVGTETRGVSQREGSVSATARFLIESRIYSFDEQYKSEDLISPLIPINDAHLVLGLEPLETVRNLKFISEQTLVIMNTHQLYPRSVIIDSTREKDYPSVAYIIDLLDQFARRIVALNVTELAQKKLGNSRYVNSIILGMATKEFQPIFIKKTIKKVLETFFGDPEKNIDAFDLGYSL